MRGRRKRGKKRKEIEGRETKKEENDTCLGEAVSKLE